MALFGKDQPVPPRDLRSFVASAREIKVSDPNEAQIARRRRKQWQQKAWATFDDVGESKFATNWVAGKVSQVKLFPAIIPPGDTPPVPVTDGAPVEALERLKRPYSSHAHLLHPWAINWLVAGDCSLVGTDKDGASEEWGIYSIDELVPGTNGWEIRDLDETTGRVLTERDYTLRLWIRHPRYRNQADSPFRGILNAADEILWLERMVRGIARSRAALNGLLKVPSELSFGPSDPTESDSAEGIDEDPFIKEFIEAATTAIKEEESAAGTLPLIVRGPAEFLDSLSQLAFDRPFDEQIDVRTERAIRRLAQGLNIPPEVVLGMQDTNHWVAWAIAEDAFKSHLEPFIRMMCDALTVGYFWPALGITRAGPDTPVVWYDPTPIIARPDRAADLKYGHETGAVSDEAWRKGTGIPDTDAPDVEEIVKRMILKRGAIDPYIVEAYLKKVAPELIVVRPQNQQGATPDAPADTGYDAPPSTPTETAPTSPSSRSNTVPVAASLRIQLSGATDAAVRRAIELAGSRIRTRVQKDKAATDDISGTPNLAVPHRLQREKVEQAMNGSYDKIFEGGFSTLREQMFLWADKAGIEGQVITSAWEQMHSELVARCSERMYESCSDMADIVDPVVHRAMVRLGF